MSAPALDRSTSLTGHPLRKRKAPASRQKAHVVPKTVFLLDEVKINVDDEEEDAGENEEYIIKEEMILVKGEFDLLTGANEQTIRQELKELFKVKFPLISENDFDFVKRERNTILSPVVKENHSWDYAHVKHLCGAGKLYVRLNINKDVIGGTCTPTSDDSDSTLPAMLPPSSYKPTCSANTTTSIFVGEEVPSTSSDVSLMDENISSLTVLFPEAELSDIRDALNHCGSLELAAEKLSEKADTCEQSSTSMDASGILKHLKLKMKGYGLAEKIKVDRDDLVLDLFHYYKDPNFDPDLQIKLQFRREPAIDNGGVLRQAYEDAFLALAKGEVGLKMFQGPYERLVPIYRSDNVLNGVFEVLGKMVAHSMIQGGPGFPYLSPVVYWYIATGDLQQGVARASVMDISDGILAGYVARVRDATSEDIENINHEDEFVQLMQNCGERRLLTEQNKLAVVQALVYHETLIKHKGVLDQFRKGLAILGLLKEIEKAPSKFEHLFVHQKGEINADFVKSLLCLPHSTNPRVISVTHMLLSFIASANEDVLCKFLGFVTGCKSATSALLPGCVNVSIEDTPNIFASTCTMELKLPLHFICFEQFGACLNAVLGNSSFNTV